jgi:hypothetical protein
MNNAGLSPIYKGPGVDEGYDISGETPAVEKTRGTVVLTLFESLQIIATLIHDLEH